MVAAKKKSKNMQKVSTNVNMCEFCNKTFVHEGGLNRHQCAKKKRFIERDDKHVKLGFLSFRHYMMKTRNSKKEITYELFSKNSLYNDFVNFGSFLNNINAISPLLYVDFLIKMDVGIAKWTDTRIYDMFVKELNKTELPVNAIERSFELMMKWSNDTGEHWTEFFRKISPSLATLWIKSGKISPWIILTSSSSEELLSRLNQEQSKIVCDTIDINFWMHRLEYHETDVLKIKESLEDAGL